MIKKILFLIIIISLLMIGITSAGDIQNAQSTADQINKDLDKKLPYTISLTPELLESYGYDVINMSRHGTYNITIKNASYDEGNGTLVTYLNADFDGQSLRVKNPVRWYMPFEGGIHGANANTRVQSYVIQVLNYFEQQPFGEPENDDTLIAYLSYGKEIENNATSATDWGILRNGSGTFVSSSNVTSAGLVAVSSGKNGYIKFGRGFNTFNTSSIPDSATITSVNYTFNVVYLSSSLGSTTINITNASPSDPMSYSVSDFSKCGNISMADGMSPGLGTSTITFYSSAYSYINKTGYSTFSIRNGWDTKYEFTGTYADGNSWFRNMDTSYTYITIEYTPASSAPPNSSFTANQTSGTAPLPVKFNDTSTNTPTAWNWSFTNLTGNATEVWFSQTKNVTYTFGVGNFSIKLNASNSGGWNNSTQFTIINVSTLPPVSSFTLNKKFVPAPGGIIIVNDTSTNTPTSWDWYWGDGTANSTTNNATHKYTKRGVYEITLNASNAAGSNISASQQVRSFGYEIYVY